MKRYLIQIIQTVEVEAFNESDARECVMDAGLDCCDLTVVDLDIVNIDELHD